MSYSSTSPTGALNQGLEQLPQTQLMMILEHLDDAVLLFQPDGEVVWHNTAFTKLFELPVTPAVMTSLDHLLEPINDELAERLITATHHTTSFTQDFTVRRRGQKHYFSVTVRPLCEGKIVIRGLAVFRDLTQIKRTEKMRRDFVANVSHELRTPLSAIHGYAESLAEGALEDEHVAAEFVQIILKHSTRLSTLVQDLLDLSRLESDAPPELTPITLMPIIEKVVGLNQLAMQEKAISCHVQLAQTLHTPVVLAEANSLEQVISNLIENAIKYSGTGGDIHVEIAPNTESNQVMISIKDTGIGIEAKHIPRLFERFYRVDKARSRDQGGTGLGLAIVKHIVELHGGRISVDSEPAKGTTFRFTLQAISPQPPIRAY
jgi:two-component system, OmpR family, phosphate regulon sensor histidine kinase PhoR